MNFFKKTSTTLLLFIALGEWGNANGPNLHPAILTSEQEPNNLSNQANRLPSGMVKWDGNQIDGSDVDHFAISGNEVLDGRARISLSYLHSNLIPGLSGHLSLTAFKQSEGGLVEVASFSNAGGDDDEVNEHILSFSVTSGVRHILRVQSNGPQVYTLNSDFPGSRLSLAGVLDVGELWEPPADLGRTLEKATVTAANFFERNGGFEGFFSVTFLENRPNGQQSGIAEQYEVTWSPGNDPVTSIHPLHAIKHVRRAPNGTLWAIADSSPKLYQKVAGAWLKRADLPNFAGTIDDFRVTKNSDLEAPDSSEIAIAYGAAAGTDQLWLGGWYVDSINGNGQNIYSFQSEEYTFPSVATLTSRSRFPTKLSLNGRIYARGNSEGVLGIGLQQVDLYTRIGNIGVDYLGTIKTNSLVLRDAWAVAPSGTGLQVRFVAEAYNEVNNNHLASFLFNSVNNSSTEEGPAIDCHSGFRNGPRLSLLPDFSERLYTPVKSADGRDDYLRTDWRPTTSSWSPPTPILSQPDPGTGGNLSPAQRLIFAERNPNRLVGCLALDETRSRIWLFAHYDLIDLDGDGSNGFEELVAGTNPRQNDIASPPILNLTDESPSQARFTFTRASEFSRDAQGIYRWGNIRLEVQGGVFLDKLGNNFLFNQLVSDTVVSPSRTETVIRPLGTTEAFPRLFYRLSAEREE